MIDTFGAERHPEGVTAHKGNVAARFDGDEIVINGQTSAWVSNGTIAQVAALCIPADYGNGIVGCRRQPEPGGYHRPTRRTRAYRAANRSRRSDSCRCPKARFFSTTSVCRAPLR